MKKREKLDRQQEWEREVRERHPTAAFYVEVRRGAEYVVAYDSKDAGKTYGELQITQPQ